MHFEGLINTVFQDNEVYGMRYFLQPFLNLVTLYRPLLHITSLK